MNEARPVTRSDQVLISADSHMAEPFDLWEKGLPERLRDQALRYPGRQLGVGAYTREGGSEPAARLRDMAAFGTSAQVLYPTLAMDIYRQSGGPELAEASSRVYNDWVIEYCQEEPDRLWGQAFIPLWDIHFAVHELERCRKNGLVGATIWMVPPDELPFTSNHYERFWAAAQDLGTPVSMHANTGFGPYSLAPSLRAGPLGRVPFIMEHSGIAIKTFTELIGSGVCERFPNLHVVVAEVECGWVPFWLEELDRRSAEWYTRTEGAKLTLLPSEYFARQLHATFLDDGVGAYLLQRYGADSFLWSDDYPHPGRIWPFAREVVAHTLRDLSVETKAKVLGRNVARIYGMLMPEPLPVPAKSDWQQVREKWLPALYVSPQTRAALSV